MKKLLMILGIIFVTNAAFAGDIVVYNKTDHTIYVKSINRDAQNEKNKGYPSFCDNGDSFNKVIEVAPGDSTPGMNISASDRDYCHIATVAAEDANFTKIFMQENSVVNPDGCFDTHDTPVTFCPGMKYTCGTDAVKFSKCDDDDLFRGLHITVKYDNIRDSFQLYETMDDVLNGSIFNSSNAANTQALYGYYDLNKVKQSQPATAKQLHNQEVAPW